jgi:hypothetical protein
MPAIEQDKALAQVVNGHGPCTYLLLSLLALIRVYPYLQDGTLSRIVLGLLYTLVPLGGIHAVGRDRRKLIVGLVLAFLAIGLPWTCLATGDVWLQRLMGMTYTLFLLFTIGEVLAYLLKKGPITADKLHGALAGYIMLAFLWAIFLLHDREFHAPGLSHGRRPHWRAERVSASSLFQLYHPDDDQLRGYHADQRPGARARHHRGFRRRILRRCPDRASGRTLSAEEKVSLSSTVSCPWNRRYRGISAVHRVTAIRVSNGALH